MNQRCPSVRSRARILRGGIAFTLSAALGLAPGNAHAQEAKPAPAPAPAKPTAPAPEKPAAPKPATPEEKPTNGAKPAPTAPTAPSTDASKPESAPATPAETTVPAEPRPAPSGTTGLGGAGAGATGAMPLWPEPTSDAKALEHQGDGRPKPKTMDEVTEKDRVYAEDWWAHARPVLEFHGYFRVRAQLEHKFGLGRIDPRDQAMWPRPADDSYTDYSNLTGQPNSGPTRACTESESGTGPGDTSTSVGHPCHANMQAGANMRFRLNPELHISDNVRVMAQIDMLDNLVLGSTPSGYANHPSFGGGYAVSSRNGYSPLGFYDETEQPPSAGVNSSNDSIRVKRAWAEYSMPVGEIRFGRMPFQWGLGMMFNAGDGYDDDAQSTVDRIQIITGLKPLDLYLSAAWDFPNEGITSDALALPNPEPYDLGQLDDVDQYVFSLARKKTPQLERQSLTRGDVVINGGLQLVYRHQTIANDRTSTTDPDTGVVDDGPGNCGSGQTGAAALGCPLAQAYRTESYVRRDAHAWIPDLWLQVKYKKFRFEMEASTVQGAIANVDPKGQVGIESKGDPGYNIAAWGVATELEQKLVEDKLSLGFKFGIASGDPDVDGLAPTAPVAGESGQIGTDRTFSTFRFHPSYKVDLILGRSILTRQQGTYYFRPSADYDFLRDPNGQRLGGGLAAIWTRASEFIQAPGHERDLGIELNGKIYYQSKDGALNDVPGVLGGFFTQIDYGVLFPMAGLGYPDKLHSMIVASPLGEAGAETRIAQTLRWYLGVLF